ncbi:MAG: tyrosine-type recombinase/integrase [Ghiorsea sp.]
MGKTESEMYLALSKIDSSSNTENMTAYFAWYEKEFTPLKAPSTQKEERRIMLNLIRSFGKMSPMDIKPSDVYNYHAARSKATPDGADREKALLSSMMGKLMNRGIIDKNPCIGIKKNGSKVRDRYVTDLEFHTVRKYATKPMQAAMDIAYLTGLRLGDILSLTQDSIKNEGIYCRTSKTTKSIIFLWSQALRSAVDLANESSGDSLISNKYGHQYTASGFKSLWQRMIKKVVEKEGIERYQFRDLRTKAACDTDGSAQKLLGHSTDKITNRNYRILPEKVNPTR